MKKFFNKDTPRVELEFLYKCMSYNNGPLSELVEHRPLTAVRLNGINNRVHKLALGMMEERLRVSLLRTNVCLTHKL